MSSQRIHLHARARVWALIAGLVVALGIVAGAASPAHAHDALIGTDPAADSTVEALPAQLTLTFSAAIAGDAGASVVEVTDAAGTSLVDGAPSAVDNVLTQPLTGDASGLVTVLWKVVSSDGHPTSGEFSFTVAGAPAPTPTPTRTTAPDPTGTAEPEPTATSDETPTETATPAPAEPADSTFADVWPWAIGGLLLAGAAGAVLYLAVSRTRREKALAQSGAGPAAGGPGADSEPPADR